MNLDGNIKIEEKVGPVPKLTNNLERITHNFITEVGDTQLNDEQKRIYNAFVYRRRKPYKFSVVDKYGNTIRFILPTSNKREGVVHILMKHYNGKVGQVTASEILCFLEVIRKGNLTAENNTMTYKYNLNNVCYSLIVGIKETPSNNILKSFYSDKEKGFGTDCFANSVDSNSKTLTVAKITTNN